LRAAQARLASAYVKNKTKGLVCGLSGKELETLFSPQFCKNNNLKNKHENIMNKFNKKYIQYLYIKNYKI
jgi:hypothetical protein